MDFLGIFHPIQGGCDFKYNLSISIKNVSFKIFICTDLTKVNNFIPAVSIWSNIIGQKEV